jgi:hypothetical protein
MVSVCRVGNLLAFGSGRTIPQFHSPMGTAISVFIFRLSRCSAGRLSVLSSSENVAVSADTGGGALRTASPELSIVSTSSLR